MAGTLRSARVLAQGRLLAHSLGFRRLPGRWVAALLSALLAASLGQAIRHRVPRETIAGIATAVDGDSLRIGPAMVRLAGIDAPELFQTCRGPGGEVACGEEARRALSTLLRAGPVRCEVSGLDRYERRIAQEDPFLQTADDMSFFCHGDSTFLKLDQDGRIMVSDFIREHTGISTEVALVGRGNFFQIWEPGRLAAYGAQARARLLKLRQGTTPAERPE